MRIPFTRRTTVLLALLVAATLIVGYRCRKSLPLRAVLAAGTVTPQPLPLPGFPFAAATIEGWINSNNTAAMRTHGWGIWGALGTVTSSTGGLPTYETWYTDQEVAAGPPTAHANIKFAAIRSAGRAVHTFEVPEQFHHAHTRRALGARVGAAAVDVHAQPLVTMNFDADYAQFIWNNNYQSPATIWGLQANWGTGPVSGRVIKPFTPPSVGLKPVYQFVNGPKHNNGLTTVKYWLGDLTTGPSNSSNPQYPDPTTWNQCVVVNTGTAKNPGNLTCFGSTTKATGMVPVSQFYNYPLTAAEATTVCGQLNLPSPCAIQAGDYAILVAMHVTTKEDSNWTWQSFWWNYNQPFPYRPPSTTTRCAPAIP